MAVGDLVTAYNMYELNGLVLGHGTDYIVSKIEGLYGKTDIKTTDFDRMDAWGEYPGRNMYKGRNITMTLDIVGLPDPNAQYPIQTNYDNLLAALTLPEVQGQAPPIQLVHWRPWVVAGKRFAYVYPGKIGIISDFNWVLGHIQALISLKANDPRHYALTPKNDLFVVGSGSQNNEDLPNNHGDTPNPPVVTITFTVTSGQWGTFSNSNAFLNVYNNTDNARGVYIPWSAIVGQSMAANGQYTLIVDMKARSITSNGADISGSMSPGSVFWRVVPGQNTVIVDAGMATPVNLNVNLTYSDTWSG